MANIVVGLVAIALGLLGLSGWWWSVAEFLRGAVPIVLIVFGLVAVGAGISSKDKKEVGLSEIDEDDSDLT